MDKYQATIAKMATSWFQEAQKLQIVLDDPHNQDFKLDGPTGLAHAARIAVLRNCARKLLAECGMFESEARAIAAGIAMAECLQNMGHSVGTPENKLKD